MLLYHVVCKVSMNQSPLKMELLE